MLGAAAILGVRARVGTRDANRGRAWQGAGGARVRECSGAGAPPSGGSGSAWELARLLGLRTALAPSWATAWALATWGSWAGAGWWCRVGFAEGLGQGKCCAAGPRKEAGGKGSWPKRKKMVFPNMTKDLRFILLDIETISEDYKRDSKGDLG